MAQVLAERRIDHVLIDSAGTNGYHTGEEPDDRSIRVAAKHGLDISEQRCRQLTPGDFTRFDLILGMDRYNMRMIAQRQPANASARIGLFTEIAEGKPLKSPILTMEISGISNRFTGWFWPHQRRLPTSSGVKRPSKAGFLDDIRSAADRIA